ncbi:MAG: hypothetical protein K2X99_12595 [Gemmatimonadaceae bacterium]|nr:hypothetical protein [Gemmatimonadaceae bacterium]
MSTIVAFVNGARVEVAAGSTALEALRASDPAEGDAVAAGTRVLTDSRGLPIAAASPAHGGIVLRTASVRALRDAETA